MMLSNESVVRIKEKVARYPRRKSGILPALTVAYRQLGYVDDDIYREISDVIDVPVVEIAEAASFYTMFPKEPTGKYLLQVCHNISCALLGGESMIAYVEEKLGIKKGDTTDDGLFTLISVECLGSCSTAPMMQINQDFYENLTREKLDAIIEDLRGKS
jgi:NADH-quinone oxidoreductase E subunit